MLPLKGIKVIELSRTLAGPLAGQVLGDLGADVIKVEQPVVGDEARAFPPNWEDVSCYFLSSNRNKRSITIDLKETEGLNIFKKLVEDADVVTESFRTGKAEELKVGYEDIKKINPKIIYLSISGFGRTGPDRNKAGYDIILQAFGGIMGTTGEIGGNPVKAGPSVSDVFTGVLGALSVLAALRTRDQTNIGQFIDCSLLDSQVMLLNHFATGFFATGKSASAMGSSHQSLVPYQAFNTMDRPVIIAVGNDNLWRKLCNSLGWTDLLSEPLYSTNPKRVENREELISIISERLSKMESKVLMNKLDSAGVPNSQINSVEEVVNSPQVIAREGMIDIAHPLINDFKVPAFPAKFSEMKPSNKRHPPLLGEHTEEILMELGYKLNEIDYLKSANTI